MDSKAAKLEEVDQKTTINKYSIMMLVNTMQQIINTDSEKRINNSYRIYSNSLENTKPTYLTNSIYYQLINNYHMIH